MKLVLDTSIIIDYLRGGNSWEVLLSQIDKDTSFHIPTIVIYELFSGQSTKNPDVASKVNIFLKYFERVELTEKIAQHAGQLYREFGKQTGPADFIIAASAIDLGAKVITLNKKHFEQITGLSLYTI